MNFEVICHFPLDGETDWEVIDARVRQIAGRRSDYSGTDGKMREHGWYLKDLDSAVALKNRLNGVEDVVAVVRERISEEV